MATAKYSRYEYNATVSFTRKVATDAFKAQKAFLEFWEGKITKASFTSTLTSLGVTAIEKIFNKSAYTALPGLVATTLANVDAWEKGEVKKVAEKGRDELSDLMQTFLDNTNYASITFRVNYLAFKNLATGNVDYTIIQGNIIPTKIITNSGGTIPM